MNPFAVLFLIVVLLLQGWVITRTPSKVFESAALCIKLALYLALVALVFAGTAASANHPHDGTGAVEELSVYAAYVFLYFITDSVFVGFLASLTHGVDRHGDEILLWLTERFHRLTSPKKTSPPYEQPPVRMYKKNGPALRARSDHKQPENALIEQLSGSGDDTFVIELFGAINNKSLKHLKGQVKKALKSSCDHVRIDMNSEGGDGSVIGSMRELLTDLNSQRIVHIRVVGSCMSAAVPILCALPVDRRSALKNATFMIHSAKTDTWHNPLVKIVNMQMIEQLVQETGIEKKSLTKLMKSRKNFYFPSEVALGLGIIGAIV